MTATLHPATEIPIGHARSWLLVPGGAPEESGGLACTDVTVLDLEDGVLPARREAARTVVGAFLDHRSAWVRINGAGTGDFRWDVAAVCGRSVLAGVLLAKAECGPDVAELVRRLPGVPVVALIESALGVEHAMEIATVPGVVRLAFGKGDYRRDTGAADDAGALSYARGRIVNASRAAGLPGPVDGPASGGPAARSAAVAVARNAGMTGMLCLDEEGVAAVNTGMAPTAAELAWAASTVDRLGRDGAHVRAGCDVPDLARALRVQERAAIFGTGFTSS